MIWRTSGIVALQQESVFQLGGIIRRNRTRIRPNKMAGQCPAIS